MRFLPPIPLVFVCFFMSGCGDRVTTPNDSADDDPWSRPGNLSETPREDAEAEIAALFVSGEVVAPQALYERIRDDLATIRERYGDSLPHVNIAYHSAWDPSCFRLKCHEEILEDTLSSFYHRFDSLNQYFQLDSLENWLFEYKRLYFAGHLHSVRLIEEYGRVDGIRYMQTVGNGFDRSQDVFIVRDGYALKYFFRRGWGECESGCNYSKVVYIRSDGDLIELIGVFGDPEDDWDNPPAWGDTLHGAWWRKLTESISWMPDTVIYRPSGDI